MKQNTRFKFLVWLLIAIPAIAFSEYQNRYGESNTIALLSTSYYVKPEALNLKAEILGIEPRETFQQCLIYDILSEFGFLRPPGTTFGSDASAYESGITFRDTPENLDRIDKLFDELFPGNWARSKELLK